MANKTFIPGKDAALEDTVSRTGEVLEASGFNLESESWLNPAPNCWSVHIRSAEFPWLSANGKGTCRLACQASAQAEFLERLSTNFFFSDLYLGKHTATDDFVFSPDEKWFPVSTEAIPKRHPDGTELLNREFRTFYNPDNELTADLLHDINCENSRRGICTLPFRDEDSGETVFFPVNILHNLYASNGMAAGNTPDEGRSQALSEIMERYVKNQVIARGLCLPDIPAERLQQYPRIQETLRELEENGFHVLVKDASLGGRFPVICVLLINPENSGCYAAFGANCRFEVALERTLSELLQGRQLNRLHEFQPPSHDLELVADALNLESHFINSEGLLAWRMFSNSPDYELNPWDFDGSTTEEHSLLVKTIRDQGFSIYEASYTHCGMFTCRIIVPGMSEIYPVSDLVWNNSIAGASLRTHILTLQQMSSEELREFYGILEDLQFNEEQLVSDAVGVMFEEGTAWHTLRIGELKALIALAAGQPEEAYTWSSWCVNFGQLPAPRLRLLAAIQTLLDFKIRGEDPTEYKSSLANFYGSDTIAQAELTIDGRTTFPGLTFAPSWEEISPLHARLLALYLRLNETKKDANSRDR